MTVGELIKRLQAFDPNKELMVLDGFNGGGVPREINLGPRVQEVSESDGDSTCDCDGMIGQSIVCIGFGSY